MFGNFFSKPEEVYHKDYYNNHGILIGINPLTRKNKIIIVLISILMLALSILVFGLGLPIMFKYNLDESYKMLLMMLTMMGFGWSTSNLYYGVKREDARQK